MLQSRERPKWGKAGILGPTAEGRAGNRRTKTARRRAEQRGRRTAYRQRSSEWIPYSPKRSEKGNSKRRDATRSTKRGGVNQRRMGGRRTKTVRKDGPPNGPAPRRTKRREDSNRAQLHAHTLEHLNVPRKLPLARGVASSMWRFFRSRHLAE